MSNSRNNAPLPPSLTPVVAFATGGSGTRVVARVMRHAGYHIGSNLNVSEDSLDLAVFFENRVNWYLAHSGWMERMLREGTVDWTAEQYPEAMDVEFERAVSRHRAGVPDAESKWGWKAPRSIFMLPYLHRHYPALRALHVVRDGRDMAYSQNQNQLRKHGAHVLDEGERQLPPHLQSIALWARTNLAAAAFGENYLGENYLRVRFEDLCFEPEPTAERILTFLGGASPTTLRLALAAVEPPSSIGRWLKEAGADAERLIHIGSAALGKFGYL